MEGYYMYTPSRSQKTRRVRLCYALILNAVLNKEWGKTDGPALIQLVNQQIQVSPGFTMFLSTRDPSVEFSPEPLTSLQSQVINQVLRSKRPDTDNKRTDLRRLQGKSKCRLRHLEDLLPQALSESLGNILDNDKVIFTLETLDVEFCLISTLSALLKRRSTTD
ncbi:hypothetical protein MJO28_016966 [Puccinia striiformis f. sp. tritici]|nr:hypothetical protein MJO28_016966 [Puccinia striiformis f. sp. tritici]